MSRIFLSHSSADNVAAKAFKQWLAGEGWPDEDVFLDLDNIGAGERWKDALRRANHRCEAVVLLASPEALSSSECLTEVRQAEDYGKEIIVVLLRELQLDDSRLVSFRERQIVNLATLPLSHVEVVAYQGERHEVRFNSQAAAKVKDYLFRRGIAPDHFAWPPSNKLDAAPFPGLEAFTESDAGIYFGRDADILRGLDKLRAVRRIGRPRVIVIQAASGAGKSSFLQAGLWPRLKRDPDFAPLAILRPATGIITGPEGLGRKLAVRLSRPGHSINSGDIHAQLTAQDAAQAADHFCRLVDTAVAQEIAQRRVGDNEAAAPAALLAIDQAEELLSSENEGENKRFLSLLAALLRSPPPNVQPFVLIAVRADYAVGVLQLICDQQLDFPETLPLLPLPRTSFREIIQKPLEVIARRGQRLVLSADLVDRLVDDAIGADALPLLAFTLSHLYQEFGTSRIVTLEQYEATGGVAGSIELAVRRALAKPSNSPAIPASRKDQLACMRSAFIPWLARVNPESGLAVRRVARTDELPINSRGIVERLTAARLLVADSRTDSNVVEIAHESLLRQWPELTEWLEADAEALRLVDSIERKANDWALKQRHKDWLDHRGSQLRVAEELVVREEFKKRIGSLGSEYLQACRNSVNRIRWKFGSIVVSLVILLITSVISWRYQQYLDESVYWVTSVRGYVLTASDEQRLEVGGPFRECSDCPDMMVLPPGTFRMGSSDGQGDKSGREYPAHEVTIPSRLAIAKYEITFAQFDACADHGDCNSQVSLNTHDERPAINLTWEDAQSYASWLSRITGKPYRLLSEAEYEYATRGRKQTQFPWGDSIGEDNANCGECGSKSGGRSTAPVGSFRANRFGLYDMVGNAFEWVEDCFHSDYVGSPADGSAWQTPNCVRHVVRGGSWLSRKSMVRSAARDWRNINDRSDEVGFRVARAVDLY